MSPIRCYAFFMAGIVIYHILKLPFAEFNWQELFDAAYWFGVGMLFVSFGLVEKKRG